MVCTWAAHNSQAIDTILPCLVVLAFSSSSQLLPYLPEGFSENQEMWPKGRAGGFYYLIVFCKALQAGHNSWPFAGPQYFQPALYQKWLSMGYKHCKDSISCTLVCNTLCFRIWKLFTTIPSDSAQCCLSLSAEFNDICNFM